MSPVNKVFAKPNLSKAKEGDTFLILLVKWEPKAQKQEMRKTKLHKGLLA